MTSYVPPPPTTCALGLSDTLVSWRPPAEPSHDWSDLTPTGAPLVWLNGPSVEYVLIRPMFVSIPARALDPESTGAVFVVPVGTRCAASVDDWEIRSELLRAHLRVYQPARAEHWANWLRGQDAVHS